jgi:hypothetical protein
MSYSVIQKCRDCKKEVKCADGYIIRGSVQGIIHNMQGPYGDAPGPHLGSGTVTHDCSNFEDKNAPPAEAKA